MLHRPPPSKYGRHQKTYLSREMTRAMALEHPIGDPHGGAAFGERNDPISAIISIGTLFSTGGAVLAGTATLMQGLMFAGSALSLVGNLTGNSKLSKIGMFVGLAGGVGALAESAGMFSSGTLGETFGYGSGAATGAPTAALQGTPTATPDVQVNPIEIPNPIQGTDLAGIDAGPLSASANPIAPEGGFNVNDALSGSAAPGAVPGVTPGSQVTPLNATPADVAQVMDAGYMPGNAGPAPVNAAAAGPVNATAAGPTPAGYQQISNTAAPGQTGSGWQYFADPATGQSVAIDPAGKYFYNGEQVTGAAGGKMGVSDYLNKGLQGIKGAASGMMDFAKANPGAAYMMGGAVSGAMDWVSGKTKAQIDAMEASGELSRAQAEQIRYRIAQEERRRAQLNANYQNVRPNIQVDPNTFRVSAPGLVSGAMQPPPRG